jgi:hypothetical protein
LGGGPVLLGIGSTMLIDKTRVKTGTGKSRPVILTVSGSFITVISYSIYFIIRRNVIIAKGGFGAPHYDGFNSDLLLMVIPFLTSIFAFGFSWWASKHGIDAVKMQLAQEEKEYNLALEKKEAAHSALYDRLMRVWKSHFPSADMPLDVSKAIEIISGSLNNELNNRLSILLPQILTEDQILSPFVDCYKDIARNHVEDVEYLSAVNLNDFPDDSKLGILRNELCESINNSISQIIGSTNVAATQFGVVPAPGYKFLSTEQRSLSA